MLRHITTRPIGDEYLLKRGNDCRMANTMGISRYMIPYKDNNQLIGNIESGDISFHTIAIVPMTATFFSPMNGSCVL